MYSPSKAKLFSGSSVGFFDLKTYVIEAKGVEKIFKELFRPENQLELKTIISDGDTTPGKLAKSLIWDSEADKVDSLWVW